MAMTIHENGESHATETEKLKLFIYYFLHYLYFSELVLTSVKDGSASTVRIERLDKDQINYDDVLYTGGGPYEGILINKAATGTYSYATCRLQIREDFIWNLCQAKNTA